MKAIQTLIKLLSTGRYCLNDEKKCQEDMSKVFDDNGITYKREFKLKDGIVDFFLPNSGIAIEIKVSKSWGKLSVFRQCEKYCNDEKVKGLLLATGSAQNLPPTINDKPASVYFLSETGL